ncbi:MFS transporter [Spiribacter halobius]|uniref:MFS transporter n=1 Tax=Sediminicurvatus halobius TaxID=2182432 RepID=A0A2U2MYL8_9GAMM|nr:MFS transporter [Spiribacter halobius]PWG61804.1 MFS transporter [Spiribacter halobius]UEX77643.1 MFS transporter [Spiribacter halobius]
MNQSMRLVPAGLALIAVSYGLARFAYGLFLPEMRDDVGLSPAIAGLVGGGAYAGYCVAIVGSAFLVERLGARVVAGTAGLVATVGMFSIALSTGPWALAASVLFAGISTGLASPPMAEAVARVIPAERQPQANTLINSGTSVGVALSGPIALAATGHWREAYLLFAAAAAVVTLWIVLTVPGLRTTAVRPRSSVSGADCVGLARAGSLPLVTAATGMGFASAAYWTFAGEVIVEIGGLPQGASGLAWVVIGVSGLVGGAAGELIRRFEINAVHRAFLLALGLACLALGVMPSYVSIAFVSAALFGAAYIMLTGVYLVWGVRVFSDRPAIGLGLPFLMIAVGQVIGAPIAGAIIDAANHKMTFIVFSAIAAITAATAYRERCSVTTRRPCPGPCRAAPSPSGECAGVYECGDASMRAK